jgi:hypothetical protein
LILDLCFQTQTNVSVKYQKLLTLSGVKQTDLSMQKKQYQKSGLLKLTSGLKNRQSTKYIFIDSTKTPTNLDVTKEQIDAQHRKSGLLGIGYHFIITIDGDVEKGRHVDQIGFNLDDDKGETIGIALVGHKKFNELQTKALNKLVNDLILKYGQLEIKSTIRELGI